MYSNFVGFGILHASIEVALTLFSHLPSLRFTSSQFAPTSLFTSASASPYVRAHFRYSRSSVRSARCCIPVPSSIRRCRRTGTTALYRYLPSLSFRSTLWETGENSAALGGRSGSPLSSSYDASSSISSSSAASSVSSASSESSSLSLSLLPLSH